MSVIFPSRVGYYLWGGPGTIRMINLKYFSPPVDTASFLRAYDRDNLMRIKEVFGVTDMWVTYSWGFSEEREEEDYAFLADRLQNFRDASIRVHAYVQGPNLVFEDFKDRDWFCRDEYGQFIPYHRGRKLVCVNHPEFQEFLEERVRLACLLGIDGVYVDNVFMGQMGIPGMKNRSSSFIGCACDSCQNAFGIPIPRRVRKWCNRSKEYMEFRAESLRQFIERLAATAHVYGKEFGTNSLDPRVNMHHVYGTDLGYLHTCQDYLLFESLTLPCRTGSRGNAHLQLLRCQHNLYKPMFALSYKRGIGFDAEFDQQDLDALYSEAMECGYYPCVKGTEYVTGGIWHNLDPTKFSLPHIHSFTAPPLAHPRPESRIGHIVIRVCGRWLNTVTTWYWEIQWVRRLFSWGERMFLG
ncbi:hypothetical protein COU77_03945 [Candidatus Peregrinibacteria bacterium CG10_big_fil_rev_8_21_14_0_10_49_16]|nr:MAG: hypothetical protein COW95_03990 [Candidatus Peregrinibacteria bacterium CG22_combo_CG10-13_8_21_14_all_49_11]PIR51765.1 MAG: hypothetical protein COU77_03945 [Candidatus Peregrinibacteria bacterium CG10_big_fil_rev_8_21_14_0_10_49_16]